MYVNGAKFEQHLDDYEYSLSRQAMRLTYPACLDFGRGLIIALVLLL